MGEEVPIYANMESLLSHMLSWITSKAKSVTRDHLEGFLTAWVIIITCLYIYWKRYGKKVPNYQRSLSLGALHGGKLAMQRILDAQHARIDPSAHDGAVAQLKDLLADNKKLHLSELQKVMAKLEMSGNEHKAVEMLSEALKKANNEGRRHEAYELDMLIVEMLIYKGDYDKAWSRKCLQDQDISDCRRPLFKTVIRIMQDQERDTQEFWNEFKAIRRLFRWPDCFHEESVEEMKHDFEEFEKTVKNLKKEIDLVQKNVK